MNEEGRLTDTAWSRAVSTGIGICHGIGWFSLLTMTKWGMAIEPISQDALLMAVWSTPLVAILLVQRNSWIRDILFAAAIGFVIALLFRIAASLNWPVSEPVNWFYGAGSDFSAAFCITYVCLLVIPLPFYQTARAEGRLAFPYTQLFLNAWTNKLTVLTAGFFLGISWLVLFLWGQLFGLIGIDFFANLFGNTLFAMIFSGGVFGLGVALARERDTVTQALLKLILTLFRVLAPILAGIVLLFLVALPFTGVETLWSTKIAAPLLLSTLFLLVLFQNAVIQAADADTGFWKPAGRVVMLANIALPALALLAGWGAYIRVDQYGWTPDRVYLAVLTGVALAYALTYAASVIIRRDAWTDGVIRYNPKLALGVLALAVFIHLPPLEPYRFSASNQIDRLRDGRIMPAEFDFRFLKFNLGEAGRQALKEIEDDIDLMKNPVIAQRLAEAKSATGCQGPSEIPATVVRNLTSYMDISPPDASLDATAIDAAIREFSPTLEQCTLWQTTQPDRPPVGFRCAIIIRDLTSNGLNDMILMLSAFKPLRAFLVLIES